MKKKNLIKVSLVALCIFSVSVNTVFAAKLDESAIEPIPGPMGYFVDNYKTNIVENNSPESNGVISVLSPMLSIWQPGTEWNNGYPLGDEGNNIHNINIQNSLDIIKNRDEASAINAYISDRQNQSYSAIKGLGEYSEAFKAYTNAGTTISSDIPADAVSQKYSDKGNSNGVWADESSGSIVTLVNKLRGPYASGNPSKYYFQYMRPFRWNKDVTVIPTLIPKISDTPQKDGGFPSGHTNASYLASLAMAYAVPEKYSELLLNSSTVGNDRVVSGMHSTLDVIGGRVMATALAAATLNDPEYAQLKLNARNEALTKLLPGESSSLYSHSDFIEGKKLYDYRLTYGFPKSSSVSKQMRVPKGAEVLLETRFPYLTANQRRWVLYSTGIDTGYIFLEDAEGWGRLNLYEASAGYGSFDTDITVNMDANKGGYNAYDIWSNDISGEGGLTKTGSGSLALSGNNTFSSYINILGGCIDILSADALGNAHITNTSSMVEYVDNTVNIKGNYTQTGNANLKLNIGSPSDTFIVSGTATLSGKLDILISDDSQNLEGTAVLTAENISGNFDNISISGSDKYNVTKDGNKLVLTKKD